MRAINAAKLDGTGVTVRADGDISVYAGTQAAPGMALAEASAMSGDVGAIAGAVNVAIADNDARNEAKLLGAASANNVFVEAWLQSGAPASLLGLNIGAISVGVGTLVSVDRAQNLAAVENGDLKANSLQVIAQADPLDGQNAASVELVQGAGTLVGAGVNVAVAYARVENTASADLIDLELSGDLRVLAEGSANAEASIINGPNIHGVAIGVMTGYAYALGAYGGPPDAAPAAATRARTASRCRPTSGPTPTPWSSRPWAAWNWARPPSRSTSPSPAVSTEVTAAIARAGEGTLPVLNAAGGVVVRAELNAGADANVTTAKLVFETVNIAVNVSSAKLSGTQKALVENVQLTAPSLTVTSLLNQNGGNGRAGAGRRVRRRERQPAAGRRGRPTPPPPATRRKAPPASLPACSISPAISPSKRSARCAPVADVESGTTVTLLNVALMQTIARAEAGLSAQPRTGRGHGQGGTLTVRVSYNDEATARVAPGGSAADVSLGSLTANTATADADTRRAGRHRRQRRAHRGGQGRCLRHRRGRGHGGGPHRQGGRHRPAHHRQYGGGQRRGPARGAHHRNAVYDLGSLEVLSQYKGEGAKATVGGLGHGWRRQRQPARQCQHQRGQRRGQHPNQRRHPRRHDHHRARRAERAGPSAPARPAPKRSPPAST